MPDPVKDSLTLGVVGAGAMGSGIAQVATANGLVVILYDVQPGATERARDAIWARFDQAAEKGRMSTAEAAAAKALLRTASSLNELAGCDVVVEAVAEDIAIKRKLFRELEQIVRDDAILASNTSSLPIGAIAAGSAKPNRIAGMHFFNPVPVMRLVEIVQGSDSDQATVDALVRLGIRVGRTPVVVKDTPGFLVNLAGRAFATEGLAIVHEAVATPAQVDAVMRDAYGFRMGPFELMDLTGIDVNFPVTKFVHESYNFDPRLRTTPLHRSLLEAGQLGRKTGRGFYAYRNSTAHTGPTDAAVGNAAAATVVMIEGEEALGTLLATAGARVLDHDDGRSPIVCAPFGEDCSATATRTGVDHRRLVAVDMSGNVSRRITLMTAPGVDFDARQSVIDLLGRGRAVTAIGDSPGFIAQRVVAMVANLGCEIAQMQLARPHDIDKAVELGLNYPKGPLALCEALGPRRVHEILKKIQELTGDDRYRPSQWLRRRADLGLSIFMEDGSASAPR